MRDERRGGIVKKCRLLAALVVVLCAAESLQAQTPLKWKFKEGEKFYVKSEETTKQTIEYAQSRMVGESKVMLVHAFTVKKVSKDGAVLEQTIESAEIKHSTDEKESDHLAEVLKDSTFTLTLDAAGALTKYEGYDQLLGKFGKLSESVAKSVKATITPQSLRQPLEQLFSFAPDKPVKQGDSWTRDLVVSFAPLGSFKTQNKYTHTGKGSGEGQGKTIAIELAPNVVFAASSAPSDLPFKVLSGEFKATDAKGTIAFDSDTGRTLRLDLSAKIKGDLTIEAGGKENKSGVEFEQTLHMQVLDKAP